MTTTMSYSARHTS